MLLGNINEHSTVKGTRPSGFKSHFAFAHLTESSHYHTFLAIRRHHFRTGEQLDVLLHAEGALHDRLVVSGIVDDFRLAALD